jgi:hypothetical protein
MWAWIKRYFARKDCATLRQTIDDARAQMLALGPPRSAQGVILRARLTAAIEFGERALAESEGRK